MPVRIDDSTIEVEGSVDTRSAYTIKMFVIYLVDGKEMRSNIIAVKHDF
jgi:hypothetical protein